MSEHVRYRAEAAVGRRSEAISKDHGYRRVERCCESEEERKGTDREVDPFLFLAVFAPYMTPNWTHASMMQRPREEHDTHCRLEAPSLASPPCCC